MKVQCYIVILGRDTLEAIKTKVGFHVCLREKSMGRKNRNKFITMLRNYTEGLLTEL